MNCAQYCGHFRLWKGGIPEKNTNLLTEFYLSGHIFHPLAIPTSTRQLKNTVFLKHAIWRGHWKQLVSTQGMSRLIRFTKWN